MSPQVVVLAVAVALSAASGWKATQWYYQGQIGQMRTDMALRAEQARVLNDKIELMQLEHAGVVAQRDAARRQKIRTVERVVTRKVIEYVQNPTIPHCDLPADWVYIHDAATGSGVPEDADPAGAVDDTPSGFTDVDALIVVTENYGTCLEIRNQLIGLQEWANGQVN